MERPADPHQIAVVSAWGELGDPRKIVVIQEVSAFVSTNHVYRVVLDDGHAVIGKVSNYGSYFLFAEDHDRLHACSVGLSGTRFEGMLADILTKDDRPYTWYDGSLWVAFYREVERRESLPAVLSGAEVENFGREMAEFHKASAAIAPSLPPSSKSIKSDAIHLLELLESPFAPRNYGLPPERIGRLRRHTHEFLMELERIRYDYCTSTSTSACVCRAGPVTGPTGRMAHTRSPRTPSFASSGRITRCTHPRRSRFALSPRAIASSSSTMSSKRAPASSGRTCARSSAATQLPDTCSPSNRSIINPCWGLSLRHETTTVGP
ncbi:MAG: hypothetical protein F2873_07815 [Actinobacteria bacterium]|nr:hypothetical protein [Actinomycetota bacterium]